MYYVPHYGNRTQKYISYGTIAIIVANIAVYVVENINVNFYYYVVLNFGLIPSHIVSGNQLYTLITSMFLHAGLFDSYGIFHIFFNMYVLFLFGPEVEKAFGTPLFLVFYFFSGIFAGLFHSYITVMLDPTVAANLPTIGASGAIFGVMAGYAVFYPNRKLMTFFGPMNAFIMIILFVMIETAFAFIPTTGVTGIANTAHVGGFIGGFIYALSYRFLSGKFKRKKREDQFTIVYI